MLKVYIKHNEDTFWNYDSSIEIVSRMYNRYNYFDTLIVDRGKNLFWLLKKISNTHYDMLLIKYDGVSITYISRVIIIKEMMLALFTDTVEYNMAQMQTILWTNEIILFNKNINKNINKLLKNKSNYR